MPSFDEDHEGARLTRFVLPVCLFLSACAQPRLVPSEATTPTASANTSFEMSGDVVDVDPADHLTVPPPAKSVEISNDESTAFRTEAARLQLHSEERCRLLGIAMQDQLPNIQVFEKAIIRYVGPYTFYGAGYSFQKNGQWTIGVARRFDDLNPRTIADETRTLRHEMAHTIGASERRFAENWSARDYADRCA